MSSRQQKFSIGENLNVISNKELFKKLQISCGGYSELRMGHLPGTNVLVKHVAKNRILVTKHRLEYHIHPEALEYPTHFQLFQAIKNQEVDKIMEAISNENLNKPDSSGKTPIHLACYYGNLNIVKLLCEFKPDFGIKDSKGYSPIYTCAYEGHYDCFEYLLHQLPEYLQSATKEDVSLIDIANNNSTLSTILNTIEIRSYRESETIQTIFLPSEEIPIIYDEEDLTNVPSILICGICCKKRKAFALEPCGHILCNSCVDRIITCPYDRLEIKSKRCLKFS